MKILIMLLLLSLPCFAQQSNTRIAGTVQVAEGSGYENPILGGEVGGSLNLKRVVFDGAIHYQRAKKIPGGGHNVGGNLAARIQFNKLFAGPAFAFNRQTTSTYTKSAFALGGEVGTARENTIYSFRFLQDLTSENKTRSYHGRLEWYGKGNRVGPYLAGRVGVQDFKCFQTRHCFSGSVGGTAGFWFR